MCGQVGIIFGRKHRSKAELDHFRRVFTHLLLLSERRGPHATGVGWLKCGGGHSIRKRPGKASDFISSRAFLDFLAGVDSNVTWLAGHTRWQTRGDASNNRNNHPIRAGEVMGTHNGTITNAGYVFAHFGLPRQAEVDSELIFRLADVTLANGRIDIAEFTACLALCKGQVSAVMASLLNPREVVVIKGNKPLELRFDRDRQVVIYSSDAGDLDRALAGDRGWKLIDLKPMTIAIFSCENLIFSCENLQAVKCKPFKLGNVARSASGQTAMEEIV